MNKQTRNLIGAIAVAAATLAAHAAGAMPAPSSRMDYGMLDAGGAATRTIVVGPGTRAVNVANGETVRFTVDGHMFTFAFDAAANRDSVDLSAIAPAGVAVPDVKVYIAPNPLYQG